MLTKKETKSTYNFNVYFIISSISIWAIHNSPHKRELQFLTNFLRPQWARNIREIHLLIASTTELQDNNQIILGNINGVNFQTEFVRFYFTIQ